LEKVDKQTGLLFICGKQLVAEMIITDNQSTDIDAHVPI
jgi:hypothetical protein